MLLTPENIDGRKLSVCKNIKYQLNIEKKVYGVSRIKCFKLINFLVDSQFYTLLSMNIIFSDIFI